MSAAYTDFQVAALPVQETQAGVAILEIGVHSSMLSVYHDGVLVCCASLPVGDEAITEDIRMGLLIPYQQSARLKDQYGCAWAALAPECLSVALSGVSAELPERHVSLRNLAAIIESRLREILQWTDRQISASGLSREQLLAGIVLAGPGAGLPYLSSLAEHILCLHARVWAPRAQGQAATSRRAHSLHAAIGALFPGPAVPGHSSHTIQSPLITITSTRKITGFAVGGSACRAVRHMQEAGLTGVDWIECDAGMIETDTTAGHITGAESLACFDRWLEEGPSMVLIMACLGEMEETSAVIRIASRCREKGISSFGIVTMPFACVPKAQQERALADITRLKKYIGTLQVFHYETLRCQQRIMTFEAAFRHTCEQMAALVGCLSGMVYGQPPLRHDISTIAADIRRGGMSYLGAALGDGADRAAKAIQQSIEDGLPRLADLSEAQWVFVMIRTGDGAFAAQVDEVELIRQSMRRQAGHDARIRIAWQSDASLGSQMSLCWVAAGFRGLSRRLLEALLAPVFLATDGRGPFLRLSLSDEGQQQTCIPRGFHLPLSLVPLRIEGSEAVPPRPWLPATRQSLLDRQQLHQEGRKEFDPTSDMPMVIRENAAADEGTTISARPGSDSIEDPAMQDEVEGRKRSEATTDDKLRSLSLRLDNAFDPTPEPERISPFIRRGSPERQDIDREADGCFSPISIRVDAYTHKAFLSTLNTFLYGWKPD